ncbi:phosphoglycerate dehydrogenase [Alloiococcus sp. CFN-8]|uniref:phosphoglycerate dehydrogenase n=1 Tax=Alloiococcus sp. CFN-8 TaxID=3416081 RepID=UPI003CF2D156
MNKIICLNPLSIEGLQLLPKSYEIVEDLSQATGVLVRSANMKDLKLPASLLAIARAGAGVNNIPINQCAEKGIVVFNTPGANANGVVESVIAGMLIAARDIVGGINWVKANSAQKDIASLVEKNKKQFSGTELLGKKLGVIGLGAIGYRIANAAIGLGMEVYGYDPFIPVKCAWNLSRHVKHVDYLENLLKNCDYITIHVPLNHKTEKLINKEAFEKLKDGAILLNYSRDKLVDEDALEEALESKKLRKYVTDFPNDRIVNLKNIIAIPHLGASTEEAEDNCAVMAVEELKDYIDNGNITNSVNYPDCSLGALKKPVRLAVAHKNIPNMLGKLTVLLGNKGVNIADMISKSRGEYAYALFDLDRDIPLEILNSIKDIDGVIKVRTLALE